MSKVLALQYRPTKFTEVVGQLQPKLVLRAMVKSGDVPPALIFGGTRGTGKTSSARILAAALNCDEPIEGDACAECPSCLAVQSGTSLSVLEVDAASNGGVEEVRKLREICSYAHEGSWRVVLLDEAHSMSREAFNALLKLLEEPPAGTVFVLLTTEVHKILETVRSRSMHFEFTRITEVDIRKRLRDITNAENLETSDDLLTEIARRAQGAMRDAVMMLDQTSRVGISTVTALREMFGVVSIAQPLLRAAVERDMGTGHRLIQDAYARIGDVSGMVSELLTCASELMVLKAGGELFEHFSEDLSARKDLAGRISEAGLAAAARVLWDLRLRTRHTEDEQLATMHLAFVLLTEALHPAPVAPRTPEPRVTSAPSKGAERLTLEQMRVLAGQTTVQMPIQ